MDKRDAPWSWKRGAGEWQCLDGNAHKLAPTVGKEDPAAHSPRHPMRTSSDQRGLSLIEVVRTNRVMSWSNNLHVLVGNVGLADGSVQQVTAARLNQQFASVTNAIVRLPIP